MSVNPQAAFHFSHAKQGRLAYAGSETQLAILVLVHPENVGQHKINECSGVKPISNSTVFLASGYCDSSGGMSRESSSRESVSLYLTPNWEYALA